jgi:hypothetical protein
MISYLYHEFHFVITLHHFYLYIVTICCFPIWKKYSTLSYAWYLSHLIVHVTFISWPSYCFLDGPLYPGQYPTLSFIGPFQIITFIACMTLCNIIYWTLPSPNIHSCMTLYTIILLDSSKIITFIHAQLSTYHFIGLFQILTFMYAWQHFSI